MHLYHTLSARAIIAHFAVERSPVMMSLNPPLSSPDRTLIFHRMGRTLCMCCGATQDPLQEGQSGGSQLPVVVQTARSAG